MAKAKKNKPERQNWDPHMILKILYRVWMFLFGAFKVAVGAAATVAMICGICVFVFVGILGDFLQNDIIPEAGLDLNTFALDQTSTIWFVDQNGDIQEQQKIYAATSREWASFDQIPEDMIHAAVAIEDKRFYEHQGVDWFTTIKACARMFFGDDSVGGSSITQQFIKNWTQEDSVTVQRKVLEIFRATEFEKKYDKDLIMEYYLNTIYLGNGCGGVRTAAATYFGKELELLTTAECAALISITNNPSIYDPYRAAFTEGGKTGAERNRERQLIVLDQMHEQGWIDDEKYNAAVAQEMVFKSGIADEDRLAHCPSETCGHVNIVRNLVVSEGAYYCPVCGTAISVDESYSEEIYSWITETVMEDVAKALAERNGMEWSDNVQKLYMEQIRRGGYNIYTTLDKRVQDQVDAIYGNLENIPNTRSGQQLQSAIVVIDNRTGDVVAMAGGVGQKMDFDAFNRATDATLQSGSSIKPLAIYAPAFELGTVSPATVIKDLPYSYTNGAWPRNDNRKYSYARTVFRGVTASVNAIANNVLVSIGVDYSYDFAKDKFGISTLVDSYVDSTGTEHSDRDLAPLAMGAQTHGVTVRDMTNAFATFANNGIYREARTFTKVYDSDGNLVLDNTQDSETIISEKTVNYMNYCMSYAVSGGTGSGAQLYGHQVAGKTGSTSSMRDRWFCGFTGYYTAAVWVGYDNPEVINLSYNPASSLWKKVMDPLHKGLSYKALYSSDKMSSVQVCLDSGKLATDACRSDVRTILVPDFSRVDSAQCYWEDRQSQLCDKHVMVDYCVSGKGVANDYCRHFAQVDPQNAQLQQKALLKLNQSQVSEILNAEHYGLNPEYLLDEYVYRVDGSGGNVSWNGFHNDAGQTDGSPYITCKVHTQQKWEEYERAQQATEPSVPEGSEGGTGGEGAGNEGGTGGNEVPSGQTGNPSLSDRLQG